MTRPLPWLAGAVLVGLPFVYHAQYPLHIMIIMLIWSFAYTSWSVMGRFGLVSLGHGGFMGVGAYVTALLWNHAGLSRGSAFPWPCSPPGCWPSWWPIPASASGSSATTSRW